MVGANIINHDTSARLSKLFLKAIVSSSRSPRKGFFPQEDWNAYRDAQLENQTKKGIRKFKRNILGFFGREGVKTKDELADILINLNVASTEGEASSIVSQFGPDIHLRYGAARYLTFHPVYNADGKRAYCVSVGNDLIDEADSNSPH